MNCQVGAGTVICTFLILQKLCSCTMASNVQQDTIKGLLLSRSQVDLHFQAIHLKRDETEGSKSPSEQIHHRPPPLFQYCCPQLARNESNVVCFHYCRLVIGVCLAEQKTPPMKPSVHSEVPRSREKMMAPIDQWKETRYRQISPILLPSQCTMLQDQLLTQMVSQGSMLVNDSQIYRIPLVTVPLNGFAIALTLYHQMETGKLIFLDRLEKFVDQRRPQHYWFTLVFESEPWEIKDKATTAGKRPDEESMEEGISSTATISYEVVIRYKYGCRKHYYGDSCSHFCQPRHSALGHYQCHPQRGSLICEPGWNGTRCNEPQCPNGCIHGICERPNVCRCMEGWTGPSCNECVRLPGCLHGHCKFGTELIDWEPYTCECKPGWIGMLCNIDAQFCAHAGPLCENGGQCMNTADPTGSRPIYTCVCPPGVRGTHCEHVIQDCRYHGCNGVGICEPTTGECKCQHGFYGSRCQFNETQCEQDPCIGPASRCESKMGETATGPSTNRQAQVKFKCHCESGRYGANCETKLNACDPEQCFNGGRCVNLVNGFQCICPPKYKGVRCENAVSACDESTCANGGECLDGGTQFTCHCPFGWAGPTCRENVNECAEVPKLTGRVLCEHGAGCRDLPGSYQCLCQPRWEGQHCEIPTVVCEHYHNCSNPMRRMNESVEVELTKARQTESHMSFLLVLLGVSIPVIFVVISCGCRLRFGNDQGTGTGKVVREPTEWNQVNSQYKQTSQGCSGAEDISCRTKMHDFDLDCNINQSLYVPKEMDISTEKKGPDLNDLPLTTGDCKLDSNGYSTDEKVVHVISPTLINNEFLRIRPAQSQTISTSQLPITPVIRVQTPAVRSETPPPPYDELKLTVV